MRRIATLVALLALAIALHCRQSTVVIAVSYPAGWNLVSGPEGSHLSGAVGNLYTLQPDDTDYEVVPADSTLHSGWGYWAYFPSTGSLQAAPGSPSGSSRLTAGRWTMIGNPSAVSPATISGADVVLVYPAGGDYQAATTLAVGQGAWATGRGTVTLAVQPPGTTGAPSATAPPRVVATPGASPGLDTNPISLMTAADLKVIGLQPPDLPGYSLISEEFPTTQVGYIAVWGDRDPNSSHYTVTNVLLNATSTSLAQSALSDWEKLTRQDSDNYNIQSLGRQGVGEDDRAISYNLRTARGVELDDYAETFRRGTVVVTVDVADLSGTGSLDRTVALARLIDRRLVQRAGGTTFRAPAPGRQPSGGRGLRQSITFATARQP